MKLQYLIPLFSILFCVSCQKESKQFPASLDQLQKIEKEINEAYLEECTSDLRKKLCKDIWYIDMNDFQKDTLTATKINKNDFPLQFDCNNTIPFQDSFSGNYSGKWNQDGQNLSIEFKGDCSTKGTMRGTSYGGNAIIYNFDIKINYEIIKLDSVLHLILIDKEKSDLKITPILACY